MKEKIVVIEEQHPYNEKDGNEDVLIFKKSDNFHTCKTKLAKIPLASYDGVNFVLIVTTDDERFMEKSNFVDQIRVFCKSGHGGAGSKHFMRTKFNAQAGPDGGDGGRGGHIVLRGNKHLWTLLHLRYYKNVIAEDGQGGNKNNMTGRDGKDIVIEVPLGTIAVDEETGKKEYEILEDGQEFIWIKGGRGGLGNKNFATATRQAPEYAQPGEPGTEGWKVLELKVLADVGLVGFPNAWKINLAVQYYCSKTENCRLRLYYAHTSTWNG